MDGLRENPCSKCGTCLAACAVYQLLLEEPASPRGRLATLEAFKKGVLADTPENRYLLEACMLCGRCEAACHKGVKGREAIVDYREKGWREGRGTLWKRVLTRWYSPALLRLLRPFFSLLARTPLRERLLLPRVRRKEKPIAAVGKRGTVALFPGCVLGIFYPDLIVSIERLLAEAGVELQTLWKFDCCGAPALTQGDLATFEKRRQGNENRWAVLGIETVILPCATGVMAMRAHYSDSFSIMELGSFLAQLPIKMPIVHPELLAAGSGDWLFHRPCHQAKRDEKIGWLGTLAQTPQIRMRARNETDCCGFGGLFSIGFPTWSREILHNRLGQWRSEGIKGIVTDCPGCYMQFRELGDLPVLYYTELFAQ